MVESPVDERLLTQLTLLLYNDQGHQVQVESCGDCHWCDQETQIAQFYVKEVDADAAFRREE